MQFFFLPEFAQPNGALLCVRCAGDRHSVVDESGNDQVTS
jgi:hypothetical protein